MNKRNSSKILIKIAKKLGVFKAEDIETLTGYSKVEVTLLLEKLVLRKILKVENDVFTLIPQDEKPKRKTSDILSERKVLAFLVKKPKEVYFKRINDIVGYHEFYFAPIRIKNHIKKMLTVLKEAHGLSVEKQKEIFKRHGTSLKSYRKFRDEISQNGFINILSKYDYEPGEIYYFFKEYYLSIRRYTEDEAWELAIKRFERMLPQNIVVNRQNISSAQRMHNRLRKEYKGEGIEKFRKVNFSEFEVESILPYEIDDE